METVKFKSRKDRFFTSLMITLTTIILLSLVSVVIFFGYGIAYIAIMAASIPALIFFYSIYFRTYYILTDEKLFFRSGLFHGNVPLKSIKKAEVNTTAWIGKRPATARQGVLIHFNNFDELYISPDSNERFVDALLNRNSSIEIVRHNDS